MTRKFPSAVDRQRGPAEQFVVAWQGFATAIPAARDVRGSGQGANSRRTVVWP
jgi:hypothetical protein